ncbi:extracellular solute-binding protein [Paenibacillus sp. GCM10023248]|uniref:extracellular solute-binding protein n=1 Tax=Bacillales TaxID=1385 RepID=UPI002378709E|nr:MULTISPECIES: extracellular solute-binding protein [Bacillales]MDD9269552.1 extracellular solute-binding protein [Paenibacillus sp. MAHUQ-63]MDR6880831.1 putative aldouronate transport system substrate-binding protein [Bacillus sp. 3255]
MKRKKMIKGVSTTVALSVLLTACQTGGTPEPTKDAVAKVSEPAAAQKDPNAKIVDKKTEISVYMRPRPESVESNDLPWMKPIVEKTNVYFKWVKAPNETKDYIEKFNLTLAGGNLPDLMEATPDLLNKGGENGIFEPLNKLIDQYMPNFKKVMDADPKIMKEIKSDDGNIYFFPQISAVKTINLNIFRQDWLDKLGLKAPTTTEEMYQVLKAFKEKDPNGNGKNDEIPFTTRNKTKGLLPFFEPFGVSLEEDFYADNGKVKYTFTNPQLKEALTYVSKLYKEGLIDKEYVTNDQKVWESRFTNQVSGLTFDSFPRIEYLEKLVGKANPNTVMTGTIPLKGPSGAEPYTKSQQTLIKNGFALSSKSKYKVEIAKMQDWFYSPEGQLAMNFGKLGETYTMENNQPKYTDAIMKDANNSPLIKMYELGHREFAYQWDIRYENAMVTPKIEKIRDSITPFIKDKFPVSLSFNQEERDVLNSKYTEITTYKDEMINKFIMGTEPLDKFDDFVAHINSMGLDNVLKIQQAAYDRYAKR